MAAITSVVGASYTTISFFKTLHPLIEKWSRVLVSLFILTSTAIFLLQQSSAVSLLIIAGGVNGLILPIALALILLAANQKRIVGDYKHPLWMQVAGWLVVAGTARDLKLALQSSRRVASNAQVNSTVSGLQESRLTV